MRLLCCVLRQEALPQIPSLYLEIRTVTKPTNVLSAVSLRTAMNKNIIQGDRVVILQVVACDQVLRLYGIKKEWANNGMNKNYCVLFSKFFAHEQAFPRSSPVSPVVQRSCSFQAITNYVSETSTKIGCFPSIEKTLR